LRRTIITSNRFTTFIQSWLVKTSLLFFVAVFIFFSCGSDLNTIGFRPDENRFKVSYKEFELPSSTLLAEPLVTSNVGGDGATPRVLVGSYTDEYFGKVESAAYLQLRPSSLNGTVPANATLESAVLNLSFDYYHYGTNDPIDMNFYVHEITDSLITSQKYTSDAVIDYSPVPIGLATYGISPSGFDQRSAINTDADLTNNAYDTVTIALDRTYAESLFQNAKANTNDYLLFKNFRRIFKGLAIRSEAATQIVGINPSYVATGNPRSRLIVNYNYTDDAGAAQKGVLYYFLYEDPTGLASVSFSKIKSDRTNTPFQGILDLHKELYPDGDNRFVEAGDPIATKFDISDFFSFSDTIPNMLINSAEIVIDPLDATLYKVPNNLALRVLSSKNHFLLSTDTISSLYTGLVVSDKDGNLLLGLGTGTSASIKTLLLTLTNNVYTYNSLLTQHFQVLYSIKDHTQRLTRYALVAVDPAIGKSVNRLVFNKKSLKLKIYYTTPSTKKE
jgi:hypothetical protein